MEDFSLTSAARADLVIAELLGAGLAKLAILLAMPLQQSPDAGRFTSQELRDLFEIGDSFVDSTMCELSTGNHAPRYRV